MSKQLTPMQELIEYLEKYKEVIGMTAVMIIDKAKSLLPAERKMVEDEMEREVVGFTEFCGKHSIVYYAVDDVWLYFDKTGRYNYTTAQLYQLYKESCTQDT